MYEEWSKKDPVELFEKVLIEAGVIDTDTAAEVRKDARQVAIDARRKALADPMPDPGNIEEGVYADCTTVTKVQERERARRTPVRQPIWRPSASPWITRWTVIPTSSSSARTSASSAARSRSPRVSWTSTGRVGSSTPRIAETGFTGLAAGAALVGLRPVVEFQFADFISCAFDPIINVLARHHWRTGDPMPVTMRAPFGGRLRAGPTHSQSVESYFAHVPGLKIVMPGTPEDAAGLLISSIRDNNPTLYLENKYLYRRLKAAGPISLEPIPLGVANVVREGRDVSLITYSAGVHQGLEIADELDKEGISVEVVDVRTLVPLDVETIVNSVKKTARAVVLHEAATRMGYGAEIAATIQEEAFWYLDQPILRIGAKNTPTPTSPPLEDAVIPQPADIAAAIRKVAKA